MLHKVRRGAHARTHCLWGLNFSTSVYTATDIPLTYTSRRIPLGERKEHPSPHNIMTKRSYRIFTTARTIVNGAPGTHKTKNWSHFPVLNAKLLANPMSTPKHTAPIKDDTNNSRGRLIRPEQQLPDHLHHLPYLPSYPPPDDSLRSSSG